MVEDGGRGWLCRGARAVGQGLSGVSLPRLVRPEGPVARERMGGPRAPGTEKEKVGWGWGSILFSVLLEII